jgi:hypothetical protein
LNVCVCCPWLSHFAFIVANFSLSRHFSPSRISLTD